MILLLCESLGFLRRINTVPYDPSVLSLAGCSPYHAAGVDSYLDVLSIYCQIKPSSERGLLPETCDRVPMGLVTPGILIHYSSRSVRGVRRVRTNRILEGRAIYGLSQIPNASCLIRRPRYLALTNPSSHHQAHLHSPEWPPSTPFISFSTA